MVARKVRRRNAWRERRRRFCERTLTDSVRERRKRVVLYFIAQRLLFG